MRVFLEALGTDGLILNPGSVLNPLYAPRSAVNSASWSFYGNPVTECAPRGRVAGASSEGACLFLSLWRAGKKGGRGGPCLSEKWRFQRWVGLIAPR